MGRGIGHIPPGSIGGGLGVVGGGITGMAGAVALGGGTQPGSIGGRGIIPAGLKSVGTGEGTYPSGKRMNWKSKHWRRNSRQWWWI